MKHLLIVVSFLAFYNLSFAQNETQPLSVNELKTQILSLAKSYEGQTDPDGLKTRTLNALINQLVAKGPARSMTEKAQTAVGAWHQVWGPYFYNDAIKTLQAIDPKLIYQIVSANGTYTNVGVYHLLGLKVIGLLKGQYEIEDAKLSVQFTQNGIVSEPVPRGYTIADLPALYEQGHLDVFHFPSVLPPVGIRGGLREVYVDDTLRITYGTQVGKAGEALYVLERVLALGYE